MLEKEVVKKYDLLFDDVRKELGRVVIGQEEVVNGVLRGLIANGHVLVEGIPGIAKTLIIKALAVISGCKFSRIQFTVDLLPTDIVGITTYDEKRGFYTAKGPIFSNFVIADEINRAPPKCVSGDTEVITGDGDINSMEDLFKRYNGEKTFKQKNEEWIIPKETFSVPSLNLENYKIELKPIKYLYKQRTKAPLQEVELMSGRTIKASQVHPFFTIKEGKIHNILSKDLKRNDCVLVPKKINIKGNSKISYNLRILNESNSVKEEIKRRKKLYNSIQKLKHLYTSDIIKRLNINNESDKQLVLAYKNSYQNSKYKSKHNLKHKPNKSKHKSKPRYLDYKLKRDSFFMECKQFGQVKSLMIPRIVDKRLAHFTALLISESYHNKDEICIDMKNKELILYFKELLKELFDYDTKIYKSKNSKNNRTRIVLSSKTLGRLLECIGYKTEANSGDKEIPSFILKSKENIIKEFLRMYAEAEGTVVKDSVKIVTKSRNIANKLSYLLLRFGIVVRIGKEFRIVRENKNTYYVIKIYGKFVKEFNEKIGFYGKEKQLKLESLSKRVIEKQCDLIPYMHGYIRNLRKSVDISHKKFYEFTNMNACNLENPKNRFGHSRYVLNKIYKNLNKFGDLKELKKIIDGDFYCDFVKSNNILKQDKEYTLYDLSVDGNHSFLAGFGGLIAHNTQSALLEAMQERQTTIGKETYPMFDPFFVMATQNPIESSGSLVLDENVFINGRLMSGRDLYASVKKSGRLLSHNSFGDIYNLKDSWTYSLNKDNKIVKARCMPYFLDYDDYIYKIKTRYGRSISASKDHPFLVNRNGEMEWLRVKDLKKDDLLVCPSKLPELPEDNLTFLKHDDVIQKLKSKYVVVEPEDLKMIMEKSNNLSYFENMNNNDFNKLRIALGLSKKELSTELFGYDKLSYWSMLRFFRGCKNNRIRSRLIGFFKINKPDLCKDPDKDPGKKVYLESYKITTLNNFKIDKDIIFWIAFVLSEGSINKHGVVVYQKNYPSVIERFIDVSEKKIGVKISEVRAKNGCRSVAIRSKALADYVRTRFFINGKDIPYEYLSLPASLRREFLKTFISLESSIKEDDLNFVQKSKQSVDVVSHLLLKEGFLHQIRQRKDKIFSLRIRDKRDICDYLDRIGWINGKNFEFKRDKFNYKKIARVDPNDIFRLVKLMGLNSFHTYKNRINFLDRKWYCGYKSLKDGNLNISREMFGYIIKDMENEVDLREDIDLTRTDLHKTAFLSGLSIEDIGRDIGCSPDSVYRLYKNFKNSNSIYKNQIEVYIKNRFIERLMETKNIVNKLKKIDSDDIIYENIIDIKRKKYKGRIFGLSVPRHHNYVGGFGACGINHNTYQLPQAQLDRFLFKVLIHYPTMDDEETILNTNVSLRKFEEYKLKSVITPKEILKLQRINQEIFVSKELEKYIVKIVDATRYPDKYKTKLGRYIEWGASPRASIGLFIAAKADALMKGKNFITPENIRNVAYDVLRHRVLLNYEGQAEKITTDDVVKEILYKVDVP